LNNSANQRIRFGAWARVLAEVKNSRLILLSESAATGSGPSRSWNGQASHRTAWSSRSASAAAYFELYHRLDMRSIPSYNGHTTSLDALWMGVPVVSLVETAPFSRAGWSQLSNLGLPELAAFSEDDYVRIAARLATTFHPGGAARYPGASAWSVPC